MKTNDGSDGGETGVVRVVGIGASAGGLRALENFFRAAPADAGFAYVVVQHLSPDFKSLMDDLLARHTRMAIHRVEEEMELERDSVYLIPPRKFMTVSGGKLHLQERDSVKGLEFPINVFFESLARDTGTRAVGVILSGTGSDGSEGVRAIADAGGLVLSQDPESADFDGMPKNAVGTGCCHYVVESGRIPEKILEHARTGQPYPEAVGKGQRGADPEEQGGEWHPVIRVLFKACGIDFSLYKQTTVERRIHRRMTFLNLHAVEEYADYLLDNREEVEALYRDLLIGVTEFYRDPEVYEYLEAEVIPGILKRAGSGEVRLWVAGCATGEEVYSLALSFEEGIRQQGWEGKLSLFATDAHRTSLNEAADGLYSAESLRQMSAERRERYFINEQPGMFRILPEIRRKIVFAPHNVITDPPFTRIDFLSCRNLLIYLKGEIQERVLRFFHYSLNREGTLLLGTSEGLARIESCFRRLDSRHKIFRKLPSANLPGGPQRLPEARESRQGLLTGGPDHRTTPIDKELLRSYDYILSRHVAPGAILNDQREVLHYFGPFVDYLKPESGRAQRDLLERTEGDLRLALSTLIQRARKDKAAVSLRGVRMERNGEQMRGDVLVEPIPMEGTGQFHFFVSLGALRHLSGGDPEAEEKTEGAEIDSFEAGEAARSRIQELEQELQTTKENLQATVEELQTSNEELQATNEEMLASNEELQSTNEELHSVNEELYTVNAEFERKNSELMDLNQDHQNLLASLDVGIVFLDPDLKIRKFNPAIARSFKILNQDVGRPIEHIAYQLEDQEGMLRDVRRVLTTGETVEKEVQTREGDWVLKRVVPFVGTGGETEGVVLTFTDISRLKSVEDRLGMAMQSTGLVWWEWNLVRDRLSTHAMEECILGYDLSQVEPTSASWLDRVHPADLEEVREGLERVRRGEETEWRCEHRFRAADGHYRWVLDIGRVYKRDVNGKPVKMVGTTQDIDQRKTGELKLEELRQQAEEGRQILSEFLVEVAAGLESQAAIFGEVEQNLRETIGQACQQKVDTSALQNPVERVRAVGRYLEEMVDLEREDGMPEEAVFDPATFVETTGEAVFAACREWKAELAMVDGCVPGELRGRRVKGERALVERLLTKLLSVTLGEAGERGWPAIHWQYAFSEGEDSCMRVEILVEEAGEGDARDSGSDSADTVSEGGESGLEWSLVRRLALRLGWTLVREDSANRRCYRLRGEWELAEGD